MIRFLFALVLLVPLFQDEAQVKDLVRRLDDAELEIREKAAAELLRCGPKAVAALKEALAPFTRPDGIWAPSSTWFIAASNPS